MKLKANIRGFLSYWLERHCRRYKDKLDRRADEYFEQEQAVADGDAAKSS